MGTKNNKLQHEAEIIKREIKSCFLLLMTQPRQFVVFAVLLLRPIGPEPASKDDVLEERNLRAVSQRGSSS